MRIAAVLAAIVMLMALFAGCISDTTPSVTKIPKVILDYVGNRTVVTVMALGEYRYDRIWVNHTASNGSFSESASDMYAMVVEVPQPAYGLNLTVLDHRDVYMLNCTVRVDESVPSRVQLWVREEGQTKETEHASPYTVVLEWRETLGG